MSLTSTGPSGFHLKPIVTILAAVAFVAGVYAISQQVLTENQPSASAPTEAVIEAAEPYPDSGESPPAVHFGGRLIEGLGDEPLAEASETPAVSQPAPEIVVIEGQGSLYDPLIDGKYDPDSAVQYVLVPNAGTSVSSQLVEGLGDAPFAQRPPAAAATPNTPNSSGGPQE